MDEPEIRKVYTPLNTIFPEIEEEKGIETPREVYVSPSASPKIVSVEVNEDEEKPQFVDLQQIFKDYGGRQFTKEDILADDRLMDIVRSNLEARFTPGGILTKGRRTVSGLSGAAIGGLSFSDYRDMDDEQVFEIWQNYQRSFAGGQTVTTGNEIAYGMSASDEVKAKLGAGYLLFDQMTNAFTGEGSWGEMGDAVWDYTKSAVYDPSTILSFGLGKVFGFAGTKASSAVVRKMMTKAYQDQIKKGVAKNTAITNIGKATFKSLPFATADAVIGAGVDVVYQMQRMEVDVQDEYDPLQTVFATAGSMVVIPSLVALGAGAKEFRKSGLAPQFMSYREFDDVNLKLGEEAAEKTLETKVKRNIKLDTVDENFGIIKGESKNFLSWIDYRNKSKELIEKRGEKYSNTDAVNAFFDWFWFGSPDQKTKGYYETIKDAGWVLHPAMKKKYGTTGAFAQTIKFLQPRQVKKIVKNFEDQTGQKLTFYDYDGNPISSSNLTPNSMAAHFAANASYSGRGLWISSHLSRLEKAGINTTDAMALMKPSKGADMPQRWAYMLSIYKRLLTSHLATTGANIKGFTQLVSLNTAADFVSAAISLSESGFYKYVKGDAKKAEIFYNKAWGSALGAARKGFDVISPDIPMEYADKILTLQPHIAEKLFRDVAGDGGVRDALTDFNLDKIKYNRSKGFFEGLDEVEKLGWKIVDGATKGAQTVTLVRLQDDITKRWAFGTNLNQAIMREYGMTAEDFFRPGRANEVAVEMATDRFQKNVLEKAAYRTMRETASVNWSRLQKQTNNFFRFLAREIENNRLVGTNRSAIGYIVPFGSFLNTTIATAGDLSGINAINHAFKRALGVNIDYATEEGQELLAKAIVGWSAVGLGIYADPFGISGMGAKERIENNLTYTQDPQPDGTIQDKRYDWPASTMRLTSQIVAHGLGAGTGNFEFSLDKFNRENIPPDLLSELALQLGGQAIRDLTGFEATLHYAGTEAVNNNNYTPLLELIPKFPSRMFQGVTRPFDPLNVITGLVTDGNMNPDRRQGAETTNNMLKYIDNIIGTSKDLEKRATPTRGTQYFNNVGKQILGIRETTIPNLIEQMMNAAERPYWKSIKFNGPAEVKNVMDNIAAPFFESAALKYLNNNPDYFERPLPEKRRILDLMAKEVKENVIEVVENGLPKSINLVRVLSQKNKKDVREVMEFLGVEENLEDLIKTEDGVTTLLRIKSLLDVWDDVKDFNINK